MTKKERIAATLTGVFLYFLAALFSISIMASVFFRESAGSSLIGSIGSILTGAYGFCSILIPAFFILAGSFCLSAKWSLQRAYILLISIIPFFTLVFAENNSRSIYENDTSPIAFAKIFVLVIISILLVVIEYLAAVLIATKVHEGIEFNLKKTVNSMIKKVLNHGKKNTDETEIAVDVNEDGEEFIAEDAEVDEEEAEKAEFEKIVQEVPKRPRIEGKWTVDKTVENIKEEKIDFESAGEFEEAKVSSLEEMADESDDEEDIIAQFENENKESFEEENEMNSVADEMEYDIQFDDPDLESNNEETASDDFSMSFEDETEYKAAPEDEEVPEEEFVEPDFEIEEPQESGADIDLEEDSSEEENNSEEIKETILPAAEYGANHEDLKDVFSRMDAEARADVFHNEIREDVAEELAEEEADSGNDVVPGQTAVVTENGVTKPIALPPKKKHKIGPYKIDTDLLTAYDENQYWIIDEETKQASLNLQETLKEFSIQADIIGIRKGPVVTMFEILPAPGVKLSKIVGLADNIALRLAAQSVRIVAPIPGKRAVGIEVPNADRAIVSFRECIEQPRKEWTKMAVPVVLGKDIEGETQIMDLVKTPHLLIAGSTGAGKSVCVNSMILSILYKRSPSDVKMILIDPKVVELKLYNNIPHLLTPVITESKKAMQALQYCLCEMERRYAVLDSLGCRDISSYNRKIIEQHIATEKIPYLIVIIDEFADLMATTGKQLEGVVARLCAMSRAVGIHLVLATQRPSVDVITGLIKANIPSRVAFMVAAKTDSRIIIDQVGAEKLLGKGDMLYASATDPFPVRIQGAFVSDQEVEDVVEAVKEWGEPEYIDDEIFVEEDEDEGSGQMSLFNDGADDPLYDKALDIVVQAGKASASYIQRRLSIGYNRAARLVELMEERGIVGPANGSKPREIIHMP
ncbi:MAG: hypothetical protein K6B17_08795 [Treponema sp.]|nr:hypothetical protein [Treponema sp.]